MFELFKNKSKQGIEENNNEKVYLKGTQIAYDEGLIEKLKHDHQLLLTLFQTCATALESNDHSTIRSSLKEFKVKLTSHLLTENTRFYTYLRIFFKDEAENAALVKSFKKEMSEIGSVVFNFLEDYTGDDASYDTAFKEKFDAIGKALANRIRSEEQDLYTLYIPPQMND